MTEDVIGMLMTIRAAVRRAGFGWVAALVGVLSLGLASAAEAVPVQLNYQVTHSVFGNIGTYTNLIEPSANGTTVQTRAHFQVKMLGVNMYHEDAQRTEHWQGNRLISFNGVTSKGSGSMVVRGEARGNSFVINSPQGTITAPASVRPANPWSPSFLNSNTMMRPDDGRIEQVRISGAQPTVIDIDGKPVRAQKYEVDGATRYDVWLDSQGVPVKFAVADNSGTVTFTLASCSGCTTSPQPQQVGMR